jgi:hypothetical protein
MGGDDLNGPKRRVLRRLGHMYVFLFSFFKFLLMFYIVFSVYLCFEMTDRVGMGGGDLNGPKRRETRRLGHMYVFLLLFLIYTNVLYCM